MPPTRDVRANCRMIQAALIGAAQLLDAAHELVDDLLGMVDRDREADTDAAGGLAVNAGVGGGDTHHLAGAVDQRPTRVARVDRGVGLDGIADRLATLLLALFLVVAS